MVKREYPRLYECLKKEPMFLYNYGAELYYSKDYEASERILREYLQKVADYDAWILVGCDLYQEDLPEKALAAFQRAAAMCQGRLYPLYRQMLIYERMGKSGDMRRLARIVVDKELKIGTKNTDAMKERAKRLLEKEVR